MLSKEKTWNGLIDTTEKIYNGVFTFFERKVFDPNTVRNKLRVTMLLLDEYPSDVEVRLLAARKIYRESFSKFEKFIDDDPIGNILTIAEISRKLI